MARDTHPTNTEEGENHAKDRTHIPQERCSAFNCGGPAAIHQQCYEHFISGAIGFVLSLIAGAIPSAVLVYLDFFLISNLIHTFLTRSLLIGLVGIIPVFIFSVFTFFVMLTTLVIWPTESRFWVTYKNS